MLSLSFPTCLALSSGADYDASCGDSELSEVVKTVKNLLVLFRPDRSHLEF